MAASEVFETFFHKCTIHGNNIRWWKPKTFPLINENYLTYKKWHILPQAQVNFPKLLKVQFLQSTSGRLLHTVHWAFFLFGAVAFFLFLWSIFFKYSFALAFDFCCDGVTVFLLNIFLNLWFSRKCLYIGKFFRNKFSRRKYYWPTKGWAESNYVVLSFSYMFISSISNWCYISLCSLSLCNL